MLQFLFDILIINYTFIYNTKTNIMQIHKMDELSLW